MTFDEKIENQLKKFSLKTKHYSDRFNHLNADFVELVSLINNENEITIIDIVSRYKSENINFEEIIEEDLASIAGEINDSEIEKVKDFFIICKERQDLLGENKYPFFVSDNIIKLKKNLTQNQRIYLMLLISSNLFLFPVLEQELTSEFEKVSYEALKNLLPGYAMVKQFGKNSEYTGNAQEKIKTLAIDLNLSYNKNEVANIQGNQERGLDLIAWLPFKDRVPNMISILVQCSCGKEWYTKQHETRRFSSAYYNFYRQMPIHAMCIPYALIKNEGEFYLSDEIIECLIIDRIRLIDKIIETDFFLNLNSNIIVDKLINYQEEPV
jgi:hypothetical protein